MNEGNKHVTLLEHCFMVWHSNFLVYQIPAQAADFVDENTQGALKGCNSLEDIHQALDECTWQQSMWCERHGMMCNFPLDIDLEPCLLHVRMGALGRCAACTVLKGAET